MRHPSLLDRARTVLLVIDVQEAYRPVLYGWSSIVQRVELLLRGVGMLGLPVLVTEQYPEGLGHTAHEVAARIPQGELVVAKRSMSCCGAPVFVERLTALRRSQVLVAGIETHACVLQTTHDLIAAGYQVHLASDATSSRSPEFIPPAWERMMGAGVLATTAEQALLELVQTSEASEFRGLQRLLKAAAGRST